MTRIELILATITSNENATTWAQIVEAVKAQHKVKNWILVRNELQQLINDNAVCRLRDIHNETYILRERRTKKTKILSISDHYVVCCKCNESKAKEETTIYLKASDKKNLTLSDLHICDLCK